MQHGTSHLWSCLKIKGAVSPASSHRAKLKCPGPFLITLQHLTVWVTENKIFCFNVEMMLFKCRD